MKSKFLAIGFVFLLIVLMITIGFNAVKYLPNTKTFDNEVYQRKVYNKEDFLNFLLENYGENGSSFRFKSENNRKIIYELVNDKTNKVIKEFIYDLEKDIWIIKEKSLYFRLL